MSDIMDNLSYYINKLTEIKDYIEQLENNQTQNNFSDIETYELNTSNFEPVAYLYRPKVVFIKNKKCSKCNKNHFIAQTNTVTNNFKICDCFLDKSRYEVETIKITHLECTVEGVKYYCFYNNDTMLYVNTDDVLTGFCRDDLFESPNTLYFINKEDCQAYCNYINEDMIKNE